MLRCATRVCYQVAAQSRPCYRADFFRPTSLGRRPKTHLSGGTTRRSQTLESRSPGNRVRTLSMAANVSETSKKVAVVSGANKGIGYEIARQLAQAGLRVVLTARNKDLGTEAAKKVSESTGTSDVIFRQLDIADPASVDEFGKWAEQDLQTVDILVNNAGIAYKGNIFGAEEARNTMATNFSGTRAVCERLERLLPEGGRIVNVCSLAGKLSILRSPELRTRFEKAASAEDVAKLSEEFLQAVANGSYQKEGWPGSMYGVSKLCEATYSRVLAEQLKPRGVAVYACCPGYVATDMSSFRGHKTTEQGADTPVWLALHAPAGGSGKFYSDRAEQPF
ncbi:Carbonyl reductase [NADPH] 1 [Coccomyxa sp. Obi]|nr:Carbonyl reductase [NADPH] 1 [Coccomyxa sp. Obi]